MKVLEPGQSVFLVMCALTLLPGCPDNPGSPGGADAALPDAGVQADASTSDAGVVPAEGLQVHFPPPASLTNGDAVVIRGVSGPGTGAIRINGMLASTTNEFLDWQVTVPLDHGQNTLVVEYENTAGMVNPNAAELTVTRAVAMGRAEDVAVDTARGLAVLVDRGRDQVVIANLTTAEQTVLSSDIVGGGAQIAWPQAVALDLAGNRALVLNGYEANSLIAVDLTSGQRSIVSNSNLYIGDPVVGSGVELEAPVDLAVAPGKLYLADLSIPGVVAVDPATGDRTLLANTGGSAPALSRPTSLALDQTASNLFVADSMLDAIVRIDIATGAHTVISSSTVGQGPLLGNPLGIAVDPAGARVLVADDELDALVAVDLATGDRTIIADAAAGAGPAMSNPRAVTVAGTETMVLVDNALLAVDTLTGDRTRLVPTGIGSGADMLRPVAIVPDLDNQRAFYLGGDRNSTIMAVDLATGDRTVFSSNQVGSGPLLRAPRLMVMDRAQGRLLVHSQGDSSGQPEAVVAVDLATGDRTVLSSGVTGSGVALRAPRSFALDESTGRLLVLNQMSSDLFDRGVVAVDLATGDRAVISHGNVGGGESIAYATSLVVDAAAQQAFVLDIELGTLVSVDLTTGLRTIACADAMSPDYENNDPKIAAIDSARDRFVLTGSGTPTVTVVDRTSCAPGELTSPTGYAGTRWLQALSLDNQRSVALAADRTENGELWNAVAAIDLVTGARVIVTKQ